MPIQTTYKDPIKIKVFNWLCIGLAGSLVFWPLLNSIFTILLFLLWLAFFKKQFQWTQRDTRLTCLFMALYVLVLAGSLYSANMQEAVFKIQQKAPLLIFPLLFGCTNADERKWDTQKILVYFSGFTVLACLFCMGYGAGHFFKTGSRALLHGYDMVILKDTAPFIMALYCFLSVAILLYYLSKNTIPPPWKMPAITGLLIASAFLLLLGNRNILFCWTVVIVIFLYQLVQRKAMLLLFTGVLGLILIVTVVYNPSLKRQWNDAIDFSAQNTIHLDHDESLGRGWGGKTIRVSIWKCSWDIIRVHWATGVGTGDVQDALQAAYENRKFYFASRYNRYNAHNQYIQETIASGIAGLIIFVAGIAAPLYLFIRKRSCLMYSLFLLGFIMICFTESILELNKGIVFYSFFNSLFAFTNTKNLFYANHKKTG